MLSGFDTCVTRGILANNEFGIREVYSLESVWSGGFEQGRYKEIARLIKDGKIDQVVDQYDIPKGNFPEYLEIMKFTDQDRKVFVVTVYDSNELMQDPQVIDIFKL